MRHRRLKRLLVLIVSALAWVFTSWLIWFFPVTFAVHGGRSLRTTYGVLAWRAVTGESGSSYTRVFDGLLAGTVAIFLIVTAGFVLYAYRAKQNLLPRTICSRCGYDVGKSDPRTNVCPECGALPNLRL